MFTFIHRTFLVLVSLKSSSCLQGKPLLIPRAMVVVSDGSGQLSMDTDTQNVIFIRVLSLEI